MMVLFQQGLQLRVVLMAVADTFCSRQADAVYQAGVYQFVGKYQGVCVCHGWQNACIQVITAGEDQCPVPSEQAGKHLFQFAVDGKIARQQTRGGSREQEIAFGKAFHEFIA